MCHKFPPSPSLLPALLRGRKQLLPPTSKGQPHQSLEKHSDVPVRTARLWLEEEAIAARTQPEYRDRNRYAAYVNICTHIHTCIWAHKHTHMLYMRIYAHICLTTHTQMYTQLHKYECLRIFVHTAKNACTYTCIYTHACIYIHTACTLMYTYTLKVCVHMHLYTCMRLAVQYVSAYIIYIAIYLVHITCYTYSM